MRSIIITIGDELLIGQVVNTNASFIGGKLNEAGAEVIRTLTVGDEEEDIVEALQDSFQRFDLVVVTGGLGPTHDDVTKKAVCRLFHTDLVSSPEARKNIEDFLRLRNLPWSAAAEEQTMVPRGCSIIPNRRGTAPGEFFERDGRLLIVMPGVPHEMEGMVADFVVPTLAQRSSGRAILHKTLNTAGISESALADRLGPVDRFLGAGERLAFLPSPSGVRLRLTIVGSDRASAELRMRELESAVRVKAEKYIYSTGDEVLAAALGRLLRERGLTITVAESCTGGKIADRLTDIPGSSAYFQHAVVAYSNRSKTGLLGVPETLISKHGAVSGEVAESMASGVREREGVSIGISTTGIAGPDGGTAEKPVGLVWIGYSDASGTLSLKFLFGNDRLLVKERASTAALDLVRRRLLGIE